MLRVLLAASLVGALFGIAPTADAKATAGLTITDVKLSRSSVAVTGLNTVAVTIEATGGFEGPSADPNLKLGAALGQDSGSPGNLYNLDSAAMTRYEGTTQQGKWRGVIHVPSTANGNWSVVGLGTDPKPDGGMSNYVLVDGPKLAVKGTNPPRVTAYPVPAVVPVGKPYTIRWSVINDATGKPYGSKLSVLLGTGTECDRHQGRKVVSTTTGAIHQTYAAGTVSGLHCLVVPNDPRPIAELVMGGIRRLGTVSATPAKTTAPVGSAVPVNGSVSGAPFPCPVNLQRLHGASQWRSVGTAQTRQSSGRFTLAATPDVKGPIAYRVAFPTCKDFAPTVSTTFSIRGS